MYVIAPVVSDFLRYKAFTFPQYQPLLSQKNVLALGVMHEDSPIGLAVAAQSSANQPVQLLSIFLKEPYRNKGIGSVLLETMEDTLQKAGCAQIEASYLAGKPGLERLFARCGWQAPQVLQIVCEGDIPTLAKGVMALKLSSLPPEISFFDWRKHNPADVAEVQRRRSEILPALSPFHEENRIEFKCSIGVRYQNRLIGWVIVHRIAADALRYSTIFVFKEMRNKVQHLWENMLKEALSRHIANFPDDRGFAPMLPEAHRLFSRYVKNQLKSSVEYRYTSKKLGSLLRE